MVCVPVLCTYQCNARLPLIRAEGGERSGMVGELIAKFPRHSGDLSSLKKFTQTAKMCAFSLGKSVSGASYYFILSTRTNSSL